MSDEALRNAVADCGGTNLEGSWFAVQDGATAADQVSTERLQPVYDPADDGTAALDAPLTFTGPPGGPGTHLGVYTAQTGGTFRFALPLTGDLTFNSAGELVITAVPVNVTDAA